jgi:hypothetical protein
VLSGKSTKGIKPKLLLAVYSKEFSYIKYSLSGETFIRARKSQNIEYYIFKENKKATLK